MSLNRDQPQTSGGRPCPAWPPRVPRDTRPCSRNDRSTCVPQAQVGQDAGEGRRSWVAAGPHPHPAGAPSHVAVLRVLLPTGPGAQAGHLRAGGRLRFASSWALPERGGSAETPPGCLLAAPLVHQPRLSGCRGRARRSVSALVPTARGVQDAPRPPQQRGRARPAGPATPRAAVTPSAGSPGSRTDARRALGCRVPEDLSRG